MSKLRVGIIGCGGIATTVHIPNYLKLEDKVEIVAVTDVVKEKATQCADQFGIPNVFDNHEEMLDKVDMDAVSICTPNKFHAESAVAALESGCHVLCEKPPAFDVEGAKLMEEAAKRANKLLVFGFHYRHSQEVQLLKRYIDAGELGNVYAATSTAVRRRGIPGWGVFTNKELQGGGSLIDIGVHMLDSTLYLMGYPEPELVLGTTYQEIGTRPGVGLMGDWDWQNFSVEDMGRGMILFKNGSSIILESAFAANVEKDETMQISLKGNQGGADAFPLKVYQEKHGALIDSTPVYLNGKDQYESEIESFVDSCLTGKETISNPQQGVIIQKIIAALYESAANKEAVRLD